MSSIIDIKNRGADWYRSVLDIVDDAKLLGSQRVYEVGLLEKFESFELLLRQRRMQVENIHKLLGVFIQGA